MTLPQRHITFFDTRLVTRVSETGSDSNCSAMTSTKRERREVAELDTRMRHSAPTLHGDQRIEFAAMRVAFRMGVVPIVGGGMEVELADPVGERCDGGSDARLRHLSGMPKPIHAIRNHEPASSGTSRQQADERCGRSTRSHAASRLLSEPVARARHGALQRPSRVDRSSGERESACAH